METMKFKTNIKCSGCVGKATPYLDEVAGADNWSVDLANPEKVLTISAGNLRAEDVIRSVQEAGYTAEQLSKA
jgi:copper chaperone CopZ